LTGEFPLSEPGAEPATALGSSQELLTLPNLSRPPSAVMGIVDEIFSSTSSHIKVAHSSKSLNTPPVATPPRAETPPPATEKRKSGRKSNEENVARRSSMTKSGIDADQLHKVLKEFDDAGKPIDTTPGGSPARKRQRVYGDR
jgi:cell division cycle 20-like protein 1 (cofactor of APC complex)